jgi:adenylate kinase
MASELIQYAPDPHDTTRKSVANVDENQGRLLLALEQRRRRRRNMLLDGHFSLLDATGRIVHIPVAVFRAIEPAALLLVEAEPREDEGASGAA